MNSSMYRNLTITALLMALAIMIPIMMPLKVVIPPASYTLASHVPIFLAMFLSRKMAACVVIGSTLGFFVAGFPIVIVMRAASHIIFALMGAYYIKHHPGVLTGALSFGVFNLVCAIVHAIGEVLACLLFYTTTTVPILTLSTLYLFLLVAVLSFIAWLTDILHYISIKLSQDYLSLRINNQTLF